MVYESRGTTLKLLTDYLKNRKQYTNFKGVDSETSKIKFLEVYKEFILTYSYYVNGIFICQ